MSAELEEEWVVWIFLFDKLVSYAVGFGIRLAASY